jgi:hypothetical protein
MAAPARLRQAMLEICSFRCGFTSSSFRIKWSWRAENGSNPLVPEQVSMQFELTPLQADTAAW